MVKMLFEFNEELIKEKSRYTLESIKECIIGMFTDGKIDVEWIDNEVVIKNGVHIYEVMLATMGKLSRADWFVPFITRWEWIDEEGPDDLIEGCMEFAHEKPYRPGADLWLKREEQE